MTSSSSTDVAIVAGRRPDLLGRTLDSFGERLFRHFDVAEVFANIDPIFGSDEDGTACREIILRHFPKARITEPQTPSFGMAVSTLWRNGGDRKLLHLEDDWTVLEDITPAIVDAALQPDVGMVAFAHRAQCPNEPNFGTRLKKTRFLGVTVWRQRLNGWGTSPCFIRGGLAARYGMLIDPQLDPEKQVLHDRNNRLCELQRTFRYRKLWRRDSGPLIEDIGREWRDAHNITKHYKKSTAFWVGPDDEGSSSEADPGGR